MFRYLSLTDQIVFLLLSFGSFLDFLSCIWNSFNVSHLSMVNFECLSQIILWFDLFNNTVLKIERSIGLVLKMWHVQIWWLNLEYLLKIRESIMSLYLLTLSIIDEWLWSMGTHVICNLSDFPCLIIISQELLLIFPDIIKKGALRLKDVARPIGRLHLVVV